jgi:hypothetical protein
MSGMSIADFTQMLTSHQEAIANEIADIDAQLNELEGDLLPLIDLRNPYGVLLMFFIVDP